MPMLPLPGPSAVLLHRTKTLHPDVNLIDKEDVTSPCSSYESINNFQVITKGHGYMAINVTVDSVDYTGMLFSHNNNGLPGLFSDGERKRFEDLCQNDIPAKSLGMDQWMSSTVDRQFMPGRPHRSAQPNFAKHNGRMICHSCLCIVPEDQSMPFACNCKERQRQRASRLRCGGYQPMRDRLVVVAHANERRDDTLDQKVLARRKSSDATAETTPTTSVKKSTRKTRPALKRKTPDTTCDELAMKTPKLSVSVPESTEGLEQPQQVASTSAEISSPIPNGCTGKTELSKLSEYIVRKNDNSPLQITLLKVDNSQNTLSKRINGHHHHHHHKRSHDDNSDNGENGHIRRHRKHHHGSDIDASLTDGKDTSIPVRRNSDIGCDPRMRVTQQCKPLDLNECDECNQKDEILSTEKKNHDLNDKNMNGSLNVANGVDSSQSIVEFQMENTSLSQPTPLVGPVRDKRMSLEAHISMIKERILNAPQKPANSTSNSSEALKTKSFNEIEPPQNEQKKKSLENGDVAEDKSMTIQSQSTSPSSSIPHVCLTSLAANLPDNVTSTVSALIRAEIHRYDVTKNAVCLNSYPHGVVRGALVWARAPPSAYWPGLVIGVSAKTARVAWCGEHTYNEIDIATVSDFLGALSTRFVPNAKENRNNRKLCNAIAEALALSRPPLSELDRRLNGHVAKLLSEKYDWDLSGLNVYRGGKLILFRSASAITTASSSATTILSDDTNKSTFSTAAMSPMPAVTSTTMTKS